MILPLYEKLSSWYLIIIISAYDTGSAEAYVETFFSFQNLAGGREWKIMLPDVKTLQKDLEGENLQPTCTGI